MSFGCGISASGREFDIDHVQECLREAEIALGNELYVDLDELREIVASNRSHKRDLMVRTARLVAKSGICGHLEEMTAHLRHGSEPEADDEARPGM